MVSFIWSEVSHRLPEWQQDLSSQDVEVVCRAGTVHHDPVTVVELAHGEVLRDVLSKDTRCNNTDVHANVVMRGSGPKKIIM